jgi:chromosomal replication initiation ATPase DnaA
MGTFDVLSRVAIARGTSVSRIRGPHTQKSIARIRHECMWLLRALLHMSYPEIAKALWRKDHTTAWEAVRNVQRAIADRPEYEVELRALVG